MAPKPFVKWAGGKRQLLSTLCEKLSGSQSYYEPFLGGGAVLMSVLARKDAYRHHYASDTNEDLITTYTTIRDQVEELIASLKNHKCEFEKDRKAYYYMVRGQSHTDPVKIASRLIFLNKTCFNGLYRVNSSGKFNVPMGNGANPRILDEQNLLDVSRMLGEARVEFECRDFGWVRRRAKPGDTIYMDPPYHPAKATGFTTYTVDDFTHKDLERLARVCAILDEHGCNVLLSNSDTPQVRELFGADRWSVTTVRTTRYINSDGENRAGHMELIISNVRQDSC